MDCTDKFRVGGNVFGIWLGNGWYSQPSVHVGPPMFKMLVRVEYSDSTIDYFKTNAVDYYQKEGPIRMNDVYVGEWYVYFAHYFVILSEVKFFSSKIMIE